MLVLISMDKNFIIRMEAKWHQLALDYIMEKVQYEKFLLASSPFNICKNFVAIAYDPQTLTYMGIDRCPEGGVPLASRRPLWRVCGCGAACQQNSRCILVSRSLYSCLKGRRFVVLRRRHLQVGMLPSNAPNLREIHCLASPTQNISHSAKD